MSKNIGAWTDPHSGAPQYVSVNFSDDQRTVEITVRDTTGKQALAAMSREEFALLLLRCGRNL